MHFEYSNGSALACVLYYLEQLMSELSPAIWNQRVLGVRK